MISDKVQQNAQKVEKGNRCTLRDEKSEAHAIIYIKALDDILAVTVDHALISDEEQHKKSDFLLWTFNSGNTHIIELKGKNVDAAFEQIATTIQALGKDDGTKELVTGRNILDAYIASPNKQKIPEIHSGKEKELARLLSTKCRIKPKDMFQLIHFVKVVNKQKKIAMNGRQIIISNEAPLELG